MKKGKNYYEFSNFEIQSTRDKTIIVKVIILVLLVLITVALAFISINVNQNIQISKQTLETQTELQKAQEEQAELEKQEEEKAQKEQEEERQAKLPKLTEEGKNNVENIYKSETKRAFLTFDDGPSNITSSILDTLKNENIKATFFMLGTRVEAMPEMVKRVYEEGHYIANHGYSHQYSSIYASKEAVLNEYNLCNEAVRNAIGEQEYNSHLFRFPGGLAGGKYAEIKAQAKTLLNENEIVNVDWNALTGDAETQNPNAETLMENLKNTTEGKNSVVILMHDAETKQVTADILSQVIAYLREQGYEFKSFYDIIK